jgi:hypothetical protein
MNPGDLFGSDEGFATLFNWKSGKPYTAYEEIDFTELWSMCVQLDNEVFLFLEEVTPDKPNFYGTYPIENIVLWKTLCKDGSCYVVLHPTSLQYVYKIT